MYSHIYSGACHGSFSKCNPSDSESAGFDLEVAQMNVAQLFDTGEALHGPKLCSEIETHGTGNPSSLMHSVRFCIFALDCFKGYEVFGRTRGADSLG